MQPELNNELVVPAYRAFCSELDLPFHFWDELPHGAFDADTGLREEELHDEAMNIFNQLKPEFVLFKGDVVWYQLTDSGGDFEYERTPVNQFLTETADRLFFLQHLEKRFQVLSSVLVGLVACLVYAGVLWLVQRLTALDLRLLSDLAGLTLSALLGTWLWRRLQRMPRRIIDDGRLKGLAERIRELRGKLTAIRGNRPDPLRELRPVEGLTEAHAEGMTEYKTAAWAAIVAELELRGIDAPSAAHEPPQRPAAETEARNIERASVPAVDDLEDRAQDRDGPQRRGGADGDASQVARQRGAAVPEGGCEVNPRTQRELEDDAMHEACHAVVSVRLGLPLAYTSIGQVPTGPQMPQCALGRLPEGAVLESVGYTTLAEGTVEGWRDALPDPTARANFEAFAAQASAGIVFETGQRDRGVMDLTCRYDLQGVMQIAGLLGIGETSAEPAVRAFMATAFDRAAQVLEADGGHGVERVAAALYERRYLSGAEVAAIVAKEPG